MMKYLRILIFISALIALAGCEEKTTGPGGLARLELSMYSIQFDSAQKSSETFTLLSTRDWEASCTASWVAITQTQGQASSDKVELTIYVTRNDGYPREAEVIFVNGRFTKILKIEQMGMKTIEYTSISDVRTYCDTGNPLPSETIIKGIVISDRQLNNQISYKIAYVQDDTAGLQFYFSAQHSLDFGDEITLDLSGCRVSSYNGSVQIEGLSDSMAEVTAIGCEVEPLVVSVSDFMDNKYDGRYIALDNVKVAQEYHGYTWANSRSHTSIGMEADNGDEFYVMTSKHASRLYQEVVPEGVGRLKGIASVYDNGEEREIRLIFAQESDYKGLE